MTDMRYRLVRMTGRDPHEPHRSATPLELLFDLAFVVAFGQAGNALAHAVADGHTGIGIWGFAFAILATCWAWINFSWFSSAYDTDDWGYRLITMLQMVGVVVFALGIPTFFHSLEHGGHVDNSVLVAGYVVMRIALIVQWARAARQDPQHRPTALTYAFVVGIAQVGWIAVAILALDVIPFFVVGALLFGFEMLGPVIAEKRFIPTPWHAHHIAERYSLLMIIALGEGVFGTVSAVAVLVESSGWSTEAILVVVAGVGITFGLWWTYFMMPSAVVLERFRDRSFGWGYAHAFLYAAIAATGAGLHIAAYVIEGEAEVGVVGAIVAVAVPVLVFTIVWFGIYTWLLRTFDPFHIGLFLGTVALLVLAVVLALAGASIGVCLVVITLAPAVIVVGWETLGHRHQAETIARLLAE